MLQSPVNANCLPFLLVGVLLLLSAQANASPPSWLSGALPKKGANFRDEIKCYGLPYGGIGFTSHVLTYYTMLMLANKRSPWTWKRIKAWKFDYALAILSLLATTATSIFTMVRCRHRWQFVCIALWKISMSFMLGILSLHAADKVRRSNADDVSWNVLGWIVIYLPGLLVGFIGLISAVLGSWGLHDVRNVTLQFLSFGAALTTTIGVFSLGAEYRMSRDARDHAMLLKKHDKSAPLLPLGKRSGGRGRYPIEDSESPVIFPRPTSRRTANRKASRQQVEEFPGEEEQSSYLLRGYGVRQSGITEHNPPSLQSVARLTHFAGSPALTTDSEYRATNTLSADTLGNPVGVIRDSEYRATNTLSPDLSSNPVGEEGEAIAARARNINKFLTRIGLPEHRVEALSKWDQQVNKLAASTVWAALRADDPRWTLAMLRLALLISGPFLVTVGVFGTLYCDFSLGGIAGSMVGVPSPDNAVMYWTYFIAKRLPFFSL